MKKLVIIGGGVMGLMQARVMADQGWQVTLVERGLCGSEASWAGGGIVSPLYPWRYQEEITRLATWSQSFYPNLIQSLEAESGVDPELTRHGMLVLDLDDEAQALAWSQAHQPAWIEQISSDKLYQLEPSLIGGRERALWMPHIASVRNPRLLRSLGKAITQNPNIQVFEQQAATKLLMQGDVVHGVETSSGERFEGDKVLLCSGAWSGDLVREFDVNLDEVKVEPVKGQMLIFDAKPGLVNRVVLSDGKYLIPRRDGQVLAGSTLEYEGYDKQTTEQAKQSLQQQALAICPALERSAIKHHWAGLRPGSPKGVPYIGPIEGVKGLYINAGQFRNGLVLAPHQSP